jgi:butyrate response factor 1
MMEKVESMNQEEMAPISSSGSCGDVQMQQSPSGSFDPRASFKTALCIHFTKQGKCQMEDKCTFAHGKDELRHVSPPDPNDPKYKTKLCIRFAQDQFCPNGDMCLFAHGEQELRGLESIKRSPLYKTTLCNNFTTIGVCPAGRNCQFAHGRFELRPAGFTGDFEAKIKENPKWKCVMCKLFATSGQCPRVNCDYAHGDQELRSEHREEPGSANFGQPKTNYKTVLCSRYTNEGQCYLGDMCTFAHGEEDLRKNGVPDLNALKIASRGSVNARKRTTQLGTTLGGHELQGQPLGGIITPLGAMAAAAAAGPALQPAGIPTGFSLADQQLFAEFLEFKKFKEQTEKLDVRSAVRLPRPMKQQGYDHHGPLGAGRAGATAGGGPVMEHNSVSAAYYNAAPQGHPSRGPQAVAAAYGNFAGATTQPYGSGPRNMSWNY